MSVHKKMQDKGCFCVCVRVYVYRRMYYADTREDPFNHSVCHHIESGGKTNKKDESAEIHYETLHHSFKI